MGTRLIYEEGGELMQDTLLLSQNLILRKNGFLEGGETGFILVYHGPSSYFSSMAT